MANFECCKDCPERHLACHADCKKYIEQAEAWKKRKATLAKTNRNISVTARKWR